MIQHSGLRLHYQLDLTASNFYDLIGFNKVVLKSGTNIGPKVPNLSQDTDILNIHCDLINDSLVDIHIYITDGKRRLVNLNGADTSFSLILKSME